MSNYQCLLHILPITLPALQYREFCFSFDFHQIVHDCIISMVNSLFPTQDLFHNLDVQQHFKLYPPTFIRLFRTHILLSFSRLASVHFADCMTCLTTQRILFQFKQILFFRQFLASSYKINLVAWWIAHGSLSRATHTVSHLGLVSLTWCQVRSSNFLLFASHTLISVF